MMADEWNLPPEEQARLIYGPHATNASPPQRDPLGPWMDELEAWLIAQEDAALERARKEAPS